MKQLINEMALTFKAISINESFARACIAAFCIQADPSLDEITDIKTAVSEAVTNCVVHAYPKKNGEIKILVHLYEDSVSIWISDKGIGIENIEKAREPFYTTKPDQERSGMGFTVMESFMDLMDVFKNEDKGITVKLEKKFKTKKFAVGGVNA
ncbi:MAG: anti-sigma F factor [Clostridia bacterium]|nr:anti-sigma F factor [Clostridia bacterium]